MFLLLVAVAALASLLDSSPKPALAGHSCASTGSPAGPFQMQAYEAADYKTSYARTMELAALNQLFPEQASFSLPAMERGERSLGSSQTAHGFIPPVLLKAVAWIESGWAQASYDPFVPYGEVGPTLVSHDCGYGIMQVTSGMQNVTGVPNLDQAMIGGHYAFNIARGARILADKWNQAPEFRPVVGNRDPAITEHWYYALWAYNGFAFKNHPLNPIYDPNRPPFSCGPQGDGLGHNAGAYPYQELVMGCAAHPPVRGGVRLWESVDVVLPDRNNSVFSSPLAIANWESCALSLACAAMDMPTPSVHADGTTPGMSREQILGVPVVSVSTGLLNLGAQPGTDSLPATITVQNAGSGLLSWRATTSASWLRLSRYQGVSLGTDLGSRVQGTEVVALASGLAPGSYSAEVRFESLYPAQTVVVVVQLDVSLQAGNWQPGDFNGDGTSDVMHICCAHNANIWTSVAGAQFSISPFRPSADYGMQSGGWGTADFNGDGKTDLVHWCCPNYANIWLALGDGRFAISSFQPSPDYGMQFGSWRSGDFNGDGKTDLMHLCCPNYANIWLSLGDGRFTVTPFQASPDYGLQSGAWWPGDYNGDGKTDVLHVCCPNFANLWVSLGNGAFQVTPFQPSADYGMQYGTWSVGDFNGDHRTDLMHQCCPNWVNTWLSNGAGFALSTIQPSADYGVRIGSWNAGDYNGDGKTDLLHVCCPNYSNLWQSDGSGGFRLSTVQPSPDYGMQLGSWLQGDFNRDGVIDLLHICCPGFVNVWISDRNGGFAVLRRP